MWLNFTLLLAPSLLPLLRARGRYFWIYASCSPLAVLTAAFLTFQILFLTGSRTNAVTLWLAYFVSSFFCQVLLRSFLPTRDPKAKTAPWSINGALGLFLWAILSAALIYSFVHWHYVSSSGSGAYWFHMDLLRHWRDSGQVYPPMPKQIPSANYSIGLTYHPGIPAVFFLLGAGLPQDLYVNSYGLMVAFFHVGTLTVLMAIAQVLSRRAILGLVSFLLLILVDPFSSNLLGSFFQIGTHDSPLIYGVGILSLSWCLAYREDIVQSTGIYIWATLGLVANRPYLFPFAAAVGLPVGWKIWKARKVDPRWIYPGALGLIIFSWQLVLLKLYGKLVVYDQRVVFEKVGLQGHGVAPSLIVGFYRDFLQPFAHLLNYLRFRPDHIGNTLITYPLALMVVISLFLTFGRRANRHSSLSLQVILVFSVCALFCICLKRVHWKLWVAWVPIVSLWVTWAILYHPTRKMLRFLPEMTASVLVGLFLASIPWGGKALMPQAFFFNVLPENLNIRKADDFFRRHVATLVERIPGKVLVIRGEPGDDIVFEVPGQYDFTQRFLWNDGQHIFESVDWNPDRAVTELLNQNIHWIYQPWSWSADNYAGSEITRRLKKLIDERPEKFVTVLTHPGPYAGRFYEVRAGKP